MKTHNWRVFEQFRRVWRLFATVRLIPYIEHVPRPAYCCRCGSWAWCTHEVPALCTKRQLICHECADVNDDDTDAAWSAFCNW